MTTKETTKPGHILTKDEVAKVCELAAFMVNAVWGKGGVVETEQAFLARKAGVSDRLAELYRLADTYPADQKVAVFDSLAVAFEAEAIRIDAAQNNGQKRKAVEVYPSWPPMRSEMKRALLKGIPAIGESGKPRSYGQIKAARIAVDPPTARTAEAKPQTPKIEVSPALGAAMLAVHEYIGSLDATGQTGFAEYLTSAIARHKAEGKADPIAAPATSKRRTKKA